MGITTRCNCHSDSWKRNASWKELGRCCRTGSPLTRRWPKLKSLGGWGWMLSRLPRGKAETLECSLCSKMWNPTAHQELLPKSTRRGRYHGHHDQVLRKPSALESNQGNSPTSQNRSSPSPELAAAMTLSKEPWPFARGLPPSDWISYPNFVRILFCKSSCKSSQTPGKVAWMRPNWGS